MRLIPASIACLLLPLVMTILPATLTGCGGDRYSCEECDSAKSENPKEGEAEDPSELLASTALNLIESAQFTIEDQNDLTRAEDFSNYTKIDLQFGTYAKASLDDFDKDDRDGNLMPISGELWNDSISTLDWTETKSDLDDNKLRSYYVMNSATTSSEWTLIDNDNNQHELRVYDDRIYEVWLGWTIKWEVFEAKDKGYPEIAGEDVSILADTAKFNPPILSDPYALASLQLWGDDAKFTNVSAENQAAMFVIYKQFRPVDEEGKDVALEWVALVPQVANNEGATFVFSSIGTQISPEEFIAAHTGAAFDVRVKVNEKLYISFNIDGSTANLWDTRTADGPIEIVDYTQVVSTNGSYIRFNIPMTSKVTYGLETYENPIFAQIEDGINDGFHLGWLYQRSAELAVDNPQPHYAFNDVATSDLKAAFKAWRIETYCDDSEHNDDPNRDTICATVP